MAYRLWSVDARSAAYRIHRSPLTSCAFSSLRRDPAAVARLRRPQSPINPPRDLHSHRLASFLVLSFLSSLSESIAQGVTFNVITIRINLRSFDERKAATGVSVATLSRPWAACRCVEWSFGRSLTPTRTSPGSTRITSRPATSKPATRCENSDAERRPLH
uniref:Uncharacterized protein n=1 Tax=Mycena chlorophos TaxID=658473 RepID=A0ABQ0LCV3_MYCCL|nr:predicted protein [Mycena chlorophos]